MKPDAFNLRGRFGPAVSVIAGAALALAGCADAVQPYTPIYTAPAAGGWSYRNGGGPSAPDTSFRPPPVFLPPPVSAPSPSYSTRATAPPPVSDPPPLRPVDPGPSPLRFWPSVTFLTPPADATDCTGYWRICHFY